MSLRAQRFRLLTAAALFLVGLSNGVWARDAAFLNPGMTGFTVGEEAVKVDPKAEIDIGETPINVSKKATIFFVNQTNMAVKIEKIDLSSDSLVSAEETANDCRKEGSIAPMSRCSMEISVVPTGAGTWSINVLMTHGGAGRIARARLIGRTSVAGVSETKSTGLDISARDVKPIDFGSVTVGEGKIVRSTLMVNNSADPITIYSIDVIEADSGLQRLKQGCAVDMELAPGGSCPVTLLWDPREESQVSTDLIIRHSGKLGFAVIPVRGEAKGGSQRGGRSSYGTDVLPRSSVPLPLSAKDIEKEVGKTIAPVSAAALSRGGSVSGAVGEGEGKLSLIGTIGKKAVFHLPDGSTGSFEIGDSLYAEEGIAKLIAVGSHSVDIAVGAKKRTLGLETVSSLVLEALVKARQGDAPKAPSSIAGVGAK